jgi:TolB protein
VQRSRPALLLLLAPLGALLPGPAAAEAPAARPVIEVGSPDFRPYPVAVPEVRDAASGKPDAVTGVLTEVLRSDLDLAWTFKVLDPKSYLVDPAKEGLQAAGIRFAEWVSVGAEGLIKGTVKDRGDSFEADLRFFDVTSGRQLLQKTYTSPDADARRVAHAFADEVVYVLTGTRGIFRTRLAAVKKSASGRELVVMDVDGEAERLVTRNGSINLLPSWTRDGAGLIFTSYIRHNPNLYVTPLGGGQPRLLSGERGLNTGGVMSPDGKRIALTLSRDGNSEIYVMNADGTGLRRLTTEWAIDTSPSWSPDGARLAFVSSRWGEPQIFVMNADGTGVKRLTDRGNYNQTPEWSPRGDLVAFTARDERAVFDIFTVNPETREIRRLTQDQGNNEEPTFSPSGTHLAFTSTREGKSQVWVMSPDGSRQTRVTREGGYSTPTWSPFLD